MNHTNDEIDRWLKGNTFHYREFEDFQKLFEAKQKAGVSISVCIPTLNEEATIGTIVETLKGELMDEISLVDELAVIDSGSTDRTMAIASEKGADTYLSADILPELGSHQGKGENLWKAIYQLKGEIICYVDGDIENIGSRFVTGLIAPLIYRPEVSYVKAFYDRPISDLVDPSATGGGRVTEILVRPLFSMFYPELTALIQPLSGEYAVRREVLEKLPFPIGYGVETSHLIDVYEQFGLGAFAQTDLENRVHRNQSISELGKMSFGILQSIFLRLEKMGTVMDRNQLGSIYRHFENQGPRDQQALIEIVEEERPPMISISNYRELKY